MQGIKLYIAKWKRPSPECGPVHAKAAGLYMICTLSKHEAESKGFDDSLMMHSGLYLPENHPDVVNAKVDSSVEDMIWASSQYAVSFNDTSKHFKPDGYITDYYTDQAIEVIKKTKIFDILDFAVQSSIWSGDGIKNSQFWPFSPISLLKVVAKMAEIDCL